jgi:hypothetical protein
MSWRSREGPEGRLSPVTIIWPCGLSVEEYAAAGKDVAVPRQSCPSCQSALIFWSGYARAVRSGAVFGIWVKRGYCRSCCSSEALLPSFCLVRRLDAVEVIGPAVEAVCSGVGTRRVAAGIGGLFAYTTVRGWWRRHRERAAWLLGVLGAVLGWSMPSPASWAEAEVLEGAGGVVAAAVGVPVWPAVSLISGGGWLSANMDTPTTGAAARFWMTLMAGRDDGRPP